MILSSHLLRDVEECCDEVLILKDGEIAHYCNLEEERRANRKFIEVETRGDTRALRRRRSASWAASARCHGKRRIKMVLPPERRDPRALRARAPSSEIQIRRLDYKRDSLQDIFLKAMEGGHMAVYERSYKRYDGRADARSGRGSSSCRATPSRRSSRSKLFVVFFVALPRLPAGPGGADLPAPQRRQAASRPSPDVAEFVSRVPARSTPSSSAW